MFLFTTNNIRILTGGACIVEVAALVIFLVTLVFVIWQPKGLNIAWPATGGALLSLAVGVVGPADVTTVFGIVWNATLTLIALILISAVLEHNGFFEWAALHIARFARGNGLFLFVFIILLGAAISCLFANDGAILIITPIVLSMMTRLGFSGKAVVAFVMACGFISDTASLPLVISNLVNILSADVFSIGFVEYASRMLVPSLASTAASLAVLVWFYRRSIPSFYELAKLKHPSEAVRDRRMFRLSWYVLAALLFAYVIGEWLNIPVSFIVGSAALLLLLMAGRNPEFHTWQTVRAAPWNVVIFSIGMYLVVYGLHNAGFTHWLGRIIENMAQDGLYPAVLGMGFIAGILSSVMNNLPTVMFDALAIQGTAAEGVVREALIYANVIGSDLGPKMTPIGSLATLLWLHVLAGKQVKIGWGYYFRVGVALTVPTLFVTLCGLWAWLYMVQTLRLGMWTAAAVSLGLYALFAALIGAFLILRKRSGTIDRQLPA